MKGSAEALVALNNWLDMWADYQIDLVETLDGTDDRVFQALRQRASGAASGVPFEADLFQVWSLRDGTPYRMEMFFDRGKARAAAGLP